MKFNKPLDFDTSSVTSMKEMFGVRALNPTSSRAASLRAACTTTAPTALSSPSPHLTPPCMTSLTTRQDAAKFNQPLSFDLSGIPDMEDMFDVRVLAPTSSRALPCLSSAPPLPCT